MSASVLPESGVARSDDVSDKRRAAASALREIELRSTHTPRTVRVGILGLGQVGQAVARIAPEATRLRSAGLNLRIVGALVRDISRPRRCSKPARLTTNPAAFLRGNYDVVMTDLRMPAMNGLELAERIRLTNHRIVTVLTTAWPNDFDLERALEAGVVSAILTQPFPSSQLVDVLHRVTRPAHGHRDGSPGAGPLDR